LNEGQQQHSFLFADMAGFTALTEAMGDIEAVEVAEGFFESARALLPEHLAEEVKTIGDAMMVRGESAAEAVRLGLCLVHDVGASHLVPSVRVGIHTGSAVQRGDDWFGATVNLAARVSGAAGGDEVLITDATRSSAGDLEDVELAEHGRVELKNVADPVLLYQALRAGEHAGGLPRDPVCRMAVDPAHAGGTLLHRGTLFHFCSLACAGKFASDPERYASS
jgi:class 3 adenylate cyclase